MNRYLRLAAPAVNCAAMEGQEHPLPEDAIEFDGVVLPVAARVPVGSREVEAKWLSEPGVAGAQLLHVRLEVEFQGNRVVGRVSTLGARASLIDLRAFVTRILQQELDIEGMARCEAMVVSIDTWRYGGDTRRFNGSVDELQGENLGELDLEATHRALMFPVLGSALGAALADFRAAIWDRDRTPMHAGRAVETIRQTFVMPEDGAKPSRSWERLRERLEFSRSDLQVVTEASKASRHGGMAYKSSEARVDILRRTRDVIIAYVRYVDDFFDRLNAALAAVLPDELQDVAISLVAELQQALGTNEYAAPYTRLRGVLGDELHSIESFVPALRAPLGTE